VPRLADELPHGLHTGPMPQDSDHFSGQHANNGSAASTAVALLQSWQSGTIA
jgi:hypothetical protein